MGVKKQPVRGNEAAKPADEHKASPDYGAWGPLREGKATSWHNLVEAICRRGTPHVAVVGALVALCYIVSCAINAGSNLTGYGLAGLLLIASMVAAIAVIGLYQGAKYVKASEEGCDTSSESGNVGGRSPKTRAAKNGDPS